MTAVRAEGGRQREVLEQHDGEAEQERHHGVVGPGDVGVGEGHGADVVGGEAKGVRQSGTGGDEAAVGVQDALGGGRRARGPVDPSDGAAVGGRGRENRRVRFREGAVRGEDQRGFGHPGGETAGHRGVVEAPQHPGHGEETRPRGAQRVAHLAVTVGGDEGRLDGTETGQGEAQDDRLDAGGQLPGEPAALPHSQHVQPGGDPLGPPAQGLEGHLTVAGGGDAVGTPRRVVRLYQRGRGRGERRPAREELPQSGGAGQFPSGDTALHGAP